MTFTDIQNLINNGAITGPTVAVCNCINSLATAAREKTGKIEGLIGKARDENDTEERVYFNSLDPSFLVVLGIASVMGIQLHNNLKTANPELWEELYTLINSKYFKTFISLPSDLTNIILSEVEDKASTGAPAFITGDGELYVSGDLMEAVFSSLQNAGAFNVSSGTFTPLDLPASGVTKYYPLKTTNLTLPQFEELLNNRWADFQALASNSDSTSTAEAYPILNLNNFTEYLAKLRELMGDNVYGDIFNNFNGGYMHCQRRTDGSRPYFEYNLFVITNPLNNSNYPIFNYNQFGRAGYYLVGRSYNDSSWFFTGNFIKIVYNNNTWSVQNNGGSYPVYYADGTDFWSGGNQYTYRGEWSFYTYEGGQGDTPDGLSQEEGAVLPSSSDNSFTNWAASNLINYYGDRLITGALATANIPAHNQNWFKINIPYSLGYDINLNGTTEAGDNGTVNQNDSTTISQAEENEAAGITDTGTNTETIINIYNSEEGSEPATKDQEDSGNIELEELPDDGWNAAGMTGIYAPSRAQLQNIEAWLWSSEFLDNIGKYFQDPAQALIGLYKTYFPFSTTGSQEVVFGRVGSGISAGVTNRYHEYSLGSIHVDRVFNNYMDYTGNASIYVPFCGFQSVDLKDIMEADIELVYRVEFLTGSGVAILMVTRDNMSAPLYIWQVNVFESTPVSSLNMIGTYTAGLNMVGSAVGGAVSGGSTGGVPGAIIGGIGGAAGKVGSLAQSQHVSQGGSLSGNAAFQGPKKAYLTIRYNKNASPAGYERYEGIGTDTISSIGSFKGFVKFRDVYLSVPAPDSSVLEDIESKLKEGVYI